MSFVIVPATVDHRRAWLSLRAELWPDYPDASQPESVAGVLARGTAFVALAGAEVIGFAEATLRRDFVNGCEQCCPNVCGASRQ